MNEKQLKSAFAANHALQLNKAIKSMTVLMEHVNAKLLQKGEMFAIYNKNTGWLCYCFDKQKAEKRYTYLAPLANGEPDGLLADKMNPRHLKLNVLLRNHFT